MKLLKRMLCIVVLLLAMIMVPNGQQTEAADVWVAHWNSEGIDVYVMDMCHLSAKGTDVE